MPLDPIDPGAMPRSTFRLTRNQALRISGAVEEYMRSNRLDSVRLEELSEAYVRIVFIGPDGDPADEHLLFPV